jgi:hypothetical protein
VKITEAIVIARAPESIANPDASVTVSEPWVYEREPGFLDRGGKVICSPGGVSLVFLRGLHGVRPWTPRDAQ